MNIIDEKLMECNNEGIDKCLEFIKSNDLIQMPDGSYPVFGKEIFCNLSEYETKYIENCSWEAHKKYVDLHYVVSGRECIAIGIDENSYGEYLEEKDYLTCHSSHSRLIKVTGNTGVVVNTMVPHMTGIEEGERALVKKAVFKIEADYYEAAKQKV